MQDQPVCWPASHYPAVITDQHPFLDHAPGPGALRRTLPRYLRPGLSVLDIGCGTGIGACHLAASGGVRLTYTGIDPDPAACRRARAVLGHLSPESIQGRILEQSLEQCLPSAPPPSDPVLWSFAFHDCVSVADGSSHLPIATRVAALLRPGGHLVLIDAGFAPGVSPEEVERTYAYMEKIVGHS